MSSLLLLNGSPRGAESNSMKMLSHIVEGWKHVDTGEVETLHLSRPSDFARAVDAFAEADTVLIGMPLYADAMPSLVKAYIEELARYVGSPSNPALAFVVQSGFSEALHSRGVERYFEKLARRLGSRYAGTIIRGGGESLRSMPDEANKKLWAGLATLGEQLARGERLDSDVLSRVAGVERFSPPAAAALGVALKWPLPMIMWPELRKNGVQALKGARPYVM
jgi:hypothetical protein